VDERGPLRRSVERGHLGRSLLAASSPAVRVTGPSTRLHDPEGNAIEPREPD